MYRQSVLFEFYIFQQPAGQEQGLLQFIGISEIFGWSDL
jgi:hypothetical protein